MPYSIIVEFDIETWNAPRGTDRTPRILNFSEDLYHAFKSGDVARHTIVDKATSKLIVNVKSKANVRTARAAVEKLVDAHFSDIVVSVRVEHESPA